MDYILLALASFLFSIQFLFNKRFQEIEGDSVSSSLKYSVYSSVVGLILALAMNGFKMAVTPFSFFVALMFSVSCIICNYATIMSFATVNLGLYSVFSMLGGMMLPFIYGVAFNNEPITVTKVICCIMIAALMFFNVSDLKSKNKKAIIYYMLVFTFNGLVAVFSAVHQNGIGKNVDNKSFLAMTRIITIVICGVWYVIKNKRFCIVKGKALAYAGSSSILNTVAQLFLLIALATLPASVQYPMLTGGTMIFSALISLVRNENFTLKNGIVVFLSFIATVVIAL